MANIAPEAPASKPLARRSTWRRVVFASFASILLLAGTGVFFRAGWYFYWRYEAQQRVAAEVSRLKTAGEPLTAQELDVVYRVPPKVYDLTDEWLTVLIRILF